MDQSRPLHELYKTHSRMLAKLLCNYNYHDARAIMKVYFFCTVNPDIVTYMTTVYLVDVMLLMKDGYHMVMLRLRHRHRSFAVIGDED